MKLSLSKIQATAATQARAALCQATVEEYAEAMQAGVEFPPVVVFSEGGAGGFFLGDGFHRVEAARLAGSQKIEAEVRKGGQREAILHAVGANAQHGLRRTNADKRRAVELLLRDAEWGKWSDRKIAEACGVGHAFVSNVRRELASVHGGQIGEATPRKYERGGRTHTQAPRSRPAPEPEPDEPDDLEVQEPEIIEPPAAPRAPEPPRSSAPATPTPPAVRKAALHDRRGAEVPAQLQPIWRLLVGQVGEIERHFREAASIWRQVEPEILRLCNDAGRQLYHRDDLKALREVFAADVLRCIDRSHEMVPAEVCRACAGADPACRTCSGVGWLGELVSERLDGFAESRRERGLA